jgi:hypothetical protein
MVSRHLGVLLLVVTFASPSIIRAQAAGTCNGAQPFCTGTTYTFPAATGTTAEVGPSYGCLSTRPNPAWYYMKILNSGNLVISISQVNASGVGKDVDFILWGPFTSPTAPCTAQLTAAKIVDCSYSGSATETATIPTAVTGQFYILLLTNFSNQPATITFSQTGGTGSTDCAVVKKKYAVVLLDRTGSMGVPRSTGNTRCYDALQQAKNDVTLFFTLANAEAVSVWTFGNPPTQITNGLVGKTAALAALSALPNEDCTSNTPLADAICQAVDFLYTSASGSQDERLLYVNSDGGENASVGPWAGPYSANGSDCTDFSSPGWQRNVCDHIASKVTVNVRHWDFFATQLASGHDVETGQVLAYSPSVVDDESFFRAIANATGGSYVHIADGDTDYPTGLPSMSTWGVIGLGLVLVGSGSWILIRRRRGELRSKA